jgi:hypothetical protein
LRRSGGGAGVSRSMFRLVNASTGLVAAATLLLPPAPARQKEPEGAASRGRLIPFGR